MEIITQTLFTVFLNWALTQWRLETMIILIIILVIFLIKKYKIQLTKLEICLSFICLFLFYTNLFCIELINQQQTVIQKHQEVINQYNSKLDTLYENVHITRILLEVQDKPNPKDELIKAIEKYFDEKH